MVTKRTQLLLELNERLRSLEREAELMRTVLIVKEPNTVHAAQSYDGLRKQILASAAERRSHLSQLVAMSVAVSRASSLDDVLPQIKEWMDQAGVAKITAVPDGVAAKDLFEDLSGEGLIGPLDVVEPAYVDAQTGALLRLGRAQAARTVVGEDPELRPPTEAIGGPSPVADTRVSTTSPSGALDSPADDTPAQAPGPDDADRT